MINLKNSLFQRKNLDNAYQNFIKNKIISNFENLLEEDNYLQVILLPNIKEPITKKGDEIYIFPNNEWFKGKILNGILQKGVYVWPNRQQFIGDLSPNNIFNKRGKIIFPKEDYELIGNFKFSKDKIKGENYIIEKAIYKTKKRIYEGSFRNNKLHGKFIIKNTKDNPYYYYKGNYFDGVKDGRFILEVMTFNNKKVKITGNFDKGVKNGDFKIFILNDNDSSLKEELIYEKTFKDDYLMIPYKSEDLIENKAFFNKKVKYDILCMELFEFDDKLFLLLGSTNYLLIYSINIKENKIYFEKKITIYKNASINDILYINNNKFLLCSSNNIFKLIKLDLEDKVNTSFNSPNKIDYNDYLLIQEFKGKPDSNNIFCLIKLSDNLIISGDCKNIIFWKKKNQLEEKSTASSLKDDENKKMERSKSWIEKIKDNIKDIFFGNEDENNTNENKLKKNYQENSANIYEEVNYINLSNHIYCLLKIVKSENEIILAAALPDSQRILFFNVNDIHEIEKIKEIKCLSDNTKCYISKRKKIMTYIKNNLFVGCTNKILIINLINYEIEYSVYSEQITFTNIFLDRFLILGVTKELNRLHEYEGFFIQKDLINHSKNEKTNIYTVSKYKNFKFKGNIINSKTYHINDQKIIISVGTDRQILILK